jgi:hypothetical protein
LPSPEPKTPPIRTIKVQRLPLFYTFSVINSLQDSELIMTPGLLSTIEHSLALGSGLVMFSEETQRLLCIKMNRKAAQAAGIEALAMRAIDTGDHDSLDKIAAMAGELAEELHNLALIAGEIAASKQHA